MVNTMPPLSMSLASRGTAPDQRVKKPSLLTIFVAHSKLCLYSFRASIDCILSAFSIFSKIDSWLPHRVLIVSNGWVTYLSAINIG